MKVGITFLLSLVLCHVFPVFAADNTTSTTFGAAAQEYQVFPLLSQFDFLGSYLSRQQQAARERDWQNVQNYQQRMNRIYTYIKI